MSKRDYSLSKKLGQFWRTSVYDSYGKYYENYFETKEEANKWIYYIWENEDNKVNSDDLMSKAIAECIQMDEERGVEPNLD